MCCYNVETRVLIILRHLIKHEETFTRSVKGAIRSTRCCGWHLNYWNWRLATGGQTVVSGLS
jgi:hypothetical protein